MADELVLCRKCGRPVGDPAFGSPETGWEHVGGCPSRDEPVADVVARVLDLNERVRGQHQYQTEYDAVTLAREVERLAERCRVAAAMEDNARIHDRESLARAETAEAEVARLLDLLSSTVDELESQERMTAKADAEVVRLTGVVRDVMMTARDARTPDDVALLRIADVAAHALLWATAEEAAR